ncbi:MAG: hypothetical protein EXR75_10785 [Myxococcales bacterium]|nr:hypothetical protein [Myxococcales bacterium]
MLRADERFHDAPGASRIEAHAAARGGAARTDANEIRRIDGAALEVEIGECNIRVAPRVVAHGIRNIAASATPDVAEPEPRLGRIEERAGRLFQQHDELAGAVAQLALTLPRQDPERLRLDDGRALYEVAVGGVANRHRDVARLIGEKRKIVRRVFGAGGGRSLGGARVRREQTEHNETPPRGTQRGRTRTK